MHDVPEIKRSCAGPSLATLRAWHCRELPPGPSAEIASHVASCASCREDVAAFETDQRTWNRDVSLDTLRSRAAKRPRVRPIWLSAFASGGVLAAAAAVLLLVRPGPSIEPSADVVRTKGAAALSFHVRTNDGSRPGLDGESLAPGEQLRLAYQPGAARHVLVVSIDADGAVAPLLAEAGRSVAAAPTLTMLPNALELDDDPRPERFLALFSDEPLSVEEVRTALSRLAPADPTAVTHLDLPGTQASVLIRKRTRPAATP